MAKRDEPVRRGAGRTSVARRKSSKDPHAEGGHNGRVPGPDGASLRLLLETVQDYAIFTLDAQGRVATWTAAAERVKGYGPAEAIGRHCSLFYTPEDVAAAEPQRHLDRAAQEGRFLVEGWRVRRDGQRFWAEVLTTALRDEAGALQGFGKVVRDVSRRRQHEQELEHAARKNDALIRGILDTAVDAIITIDQRGRIETFNRAARTLFGYEPAEVLGRNVRMLMPEPYRGEHDGYMANYLRTGTARIIGIGREVTGMRKDGTTFPMDLAVSEVKLGDRRTFTGIVRDLTDRKRLEREVLEVSEREQRRIGQDLHDGLCQQLTGIAFLVQALQQKLAANADGEAARAKQISALLKDAVAQARSLSHGLFPVDPQPSGLMAGLRELAGNIRNIFNIDCEFRCPEPVLIADNSVATHLYRIAQEAVQNAFRHGKASRIVIELTGGGTEPVRLGVADNGVGFATASEQDRKPGMGMRTMAHRAQVIGGAVRISPEPGGGTRIVCELPAI